MGRWIYCSRQKNCRQTRMRARIMDACAHLVPSRVGICAWWAGNRGGQVGVAWGASTTSLWRARIASRIACSQDRVFWCSGAGGETKRNQENEPKFIMFLRTSSSTQRCLSPCGRTKASVLVPMLVLARERLNASRTVPLLRSSCRPVASGMSGCGTGCIKMTGAEMNEAGRDRRSGSHTRTHVAESAV